MSSITITRRSRRELALAGELDLHSSAPVLAALADGDVEVVDVAGVTFLDSAGRQALTGGRPDRCRPTLIGASPRLQRIVDLLDSARRTE